MLLLLGFICVGLGMLGAILPILPTVPFLVVALWCFARSSEKFHTWLYNHPMFKEQLQLWHKYHVIPLVAKITAISSMVLSLLYMVFVADTKIWVIIVAAGLMAIGAGYILTKPSNPPEESGL